MHAPLLLALASTFAPGLGPRLVAPRHAATTVQADRPTGSRWRAAPPRARVVSVGAYGDGASTPTPIRGLLTPPEFRAAQLQHAAIRSFVAQLPHAMQRPLPPEFYASSVILRGQFGQEIVRGFRPYAASLSSFYASQQTELNPFRVKLTGWSYALEPGRIRVPWRGTLTVQVTNPFGLQPEPVEIAGLMAFGFSPEGLVNSHSVQLTSFGGQEIDPVLLDELGNWLGWLLPVTTAGGSGTRTPPNPARLLQLLAAAARSQLDETTPETTTIFSFPFFPSSPGPSPPAAARTPSGSTGVGALTSVAEGMNGVPIPGSDDFAQYTALHRVMSQLASCLADPPAQTTLADGDSTTSKVAFLQAATVKVDPVQLAVRPRARSSSVATAAAKTADTDEATVADVTLDSLATVDMTVKGERGVILAAGVRDFQQVLQTVRELRTRIAPSLATEQSDEDDEDEAGISAKSGTAESGMESGGAQGTGSLYGPLAPRNPQSLPYGPPTAAPTPTAGVSEPVLESFKVAAAVTVITVAAEPVLGAKVRPPPAPRDGLSIVAARAQWEPTQRCVRLQRPGEAAVHALSVRVAYDAVLQPLRPLPPRTLRLEATVVLSLRVEAPRNYKIARSQKSSILIAPAPTPAAGGSSSSRSLVAQPSLSLPPPLAVGDVSLCDMTISSVTFNGQPVAPAVLPSLLDPLQEILLNTNSRQPGTEADVSGRLVAAVLAILADGCAPDSPNVAISGQTYERGILAGNQDASSAMMAAARAFSTARSLQAELIGLGNSLATGARYEATLAALEQDCVVTGLLGEPIATSSAQLNTVLRAARVAASVVRQQADTFASVTGTRDDELDDDDAAFGGLSTPAVASSRADDEWAQQASGGGGDRRLVGGVTLPVASKVGASAAAAAALALGNSRGGGRVCACVIEELGETRVRFGWALHLSLPLLRAVRLRVRLECELSPESGLVRKISLLDARLNGAPLLPDVARELGDWLGELQQWVDVDTGSAAGEQLASRLLSIIDQIAAAAGGKPQPRDKSSTQ